MIRTLLTIALATAVLTVAWLRIETGRPPLGELAAVLMLALAPTAVLLLVRGHRRWPLAACTALLALLIAGGVAFDVPVTDARPRSERDFFGPLVDRLGDSIRDAYDALAPFDPLEYPLIHGLVLLAIFGFVLAAGVLIAAQRPVAAGLVLVVGAGWPTTLYPGPRPLAAGAIALVAILAIFYLMRRGSAVGMRSLGPAVAFGVVLVAVAVGVSTQDAVAKRAIADWQSWDLYDAPEDSVGVRYVWNSHYQGIRFPDKETVVLRVGVEGGEKRKLYWRATTLDVYTGIGWREALDLAPAERSTQIDETAIDPLLPEKAGNEGAWVEQQVEVGALADSHLIASAQPVRWRPGTGAPVRVAGGGVVVLPGELRPGQRYTAWSYVPDAKPGQLAKAKGLYPDEAMRFLELLPGVRFPAFGAPNREERVARIFREGHENFLLASHETIYRLAREAVGGARSPYAAALALESWFREQGGFTYNEQPPLTNSAEPPLVAFLLRSREGYCQHYAGAMAVMLRLLGVPARVAAGFTTGKYDKGSREWVVTDHNAHTWVEAYFPGFGWLPFDPTPGRGDLTAAYSAVSEAFAAPNLAAARDSLGRGAVLDAITAEALRLRRVGVGGFGPGGTGDPGAGPVSEEGGTSPFALGALVVLAAVAALQLAKALRRRLRFVTRDPRELATACRRDLVGFLADQRIEAPAGATLEELGRVVEREFIVDADSFVESAERARYGPPEGAHRAADETRRELATLVSQIRGQLGFARRTRGSFRFRSLTA